MVDEKELDLNTPDEAGDDDDYLEEYKDNSQTAATTFLNPLIRPDKAI